MPFGDGTGPVGLGPMTGRAAGYCAGYPVPGFMNPIPGRGLWGWGMAVPPAATTPYPYYPPSTYGTLPYGPTVVPGFGLGYGPWFGRPGFGRGFGRGWGRGRGRGRWFAPYFW